MAAKYNPVSHHLLLPVTLPLPLPLPLLSLSLSLSLWLSLSLSLSGSRSRSRSRSLSLFSLSFSLSLSRAIDRSPSSSLLLSRAISHPHLRALHRVPPSPALSHYFAHPSSPPLFASSMRARSREVSLTLAGTSPQCQGTLPLRSPAATTPPPPPPPPPRTPPHLGGHAEPTASFWLLHGEKTSSSTVMSHLISHNQRCTYANMSSHGRLPGYSCPLWNETPGKDWERMKPRANRSAASVSPSDLLQRHRRRLTVVDVDCGDWTAFGWNLTARCEDRALGFTLIS